MRYHLVLKRFEFDADALKKKVLGLGYKVLPDAVSGRMVAEGGGNGGELLQLSEVEDVLREEKSGRFQQEVLRQELIVLGKRLGSISLKVRTYPGVKIPASILKKKLLKVMQQAGVQVGDGGVPVLIELEQNRGVLYRVLSPIGKKQQGDKSRYRNLAVLLEHPRLVEEVADVLRICLIFGLELKVVHNNKNEFQKLLNKAKSLTKGKLADFHVDVYKDLDEIRDYKKIGFSKNADDGEERLREVFKTHEKILLVFGNDTFGLSQEARDKVDMLIHLTPDYKKPLKANQALAYVLGMYSKRDAI